MLTPCTVCRAVLKFVFVFHQKSYITRLEVRCFTDLLTNILQAFISPSNPKEFAQKLEMCMEVLKLYQAPLHCPEWAERCGAVSTSLQSHQPWQHLLLERIIEPQIGLGWRRLKNYLAPNPLQWVVTPITTAGSQSPVQPGHKGSPQSALNSFFFYLVLMQDS